MCVKKKKTLQTQSHATERAHSRQFISAKKLPSPQDKQRRLKEKVSSAVFRALTDKQKKFYVSAKCNLTLQTSSVRWNIPPPGTLRGKHPECGLQNSETLLKALGKVIRAVNHSPLMLHVRVKLWTDANIVKRRQKLNSSSVRWCGGQSRLQSYSHSGCH